MSAHTPTRPFPSVPASVPPTAREPEATYASGVCPACLADRYPFPLPCETD